MFRRRAALALGICLSALTLPETAQADDRCALPGEIASSRSLDPTCTYREQIRIAGRGVTLDCRGATISSAKGAAILVGVRPDSADLVVRNCRLDGGGLRVGLRAGAARRLEARGEDRIEDRAPRRILVEDLTIDGADGVGLYVQNHSSEVTIRRVRVLGSGSAGVYIDHGSNRVTLEDSEIRGNGFGRLLEPRFGLNRREGVAIDAAFDNVVRNTTVAGNAGGGIFLYRNCREHVSTKRNSLPRETPAARNRIEGNRISGGLVGVWIASRQSRDLSKWDCGDPYYARDYVLDAAPETVVRANLIAGVEVGVAVEDDGATVTGNRIERAGQSCIIVGTGPRALVAGKPVIGALVRDNACGLAGRRSDLAFVAAFGAELAGFEANATEDGPSALTERACANDIQPFRALSLDLPCPARR